MHIQITDFGTAKIIANGEGVCELGYGVRNVAVCVCCPNFFYFTFVSIDRANSFVGTAEYVSPELLQNKVAYKR